MELDLKENRDDLIFDSEHELSNQAIQMDLLIVKKKSATKIRNQIGEIFRGDNIFEYKSPDDYISIDDFSKGLAYAYLHKGPGNRVNAILFSELTLSMVRTQHPRDFLADLIKEGGTIETRYPGIYRLSGLVNIPVQFLIAGELEPQAHTWLRMLTKRADEDDVRRFVEMTKAFTEPGDKQNANAIMEVSSKVNEEVFEKVYWRTDKMFETMMKIMQPDLEEWNKKRDKERDMQNLFIFVQDGQMTPEYAAGRVGLPVTQFVSEMKQNGFSIPAAVAS